MFAAAALEGVEPVGRFLLLPLVLLLLPASDWSVCFGLAGDLESDWSDALSAAVVAILALAAALGDGAGFDGSLWKNKLPEGRSFASSSQFRGC